MTQTTDVLAEIGLLIYPECQLAAVYGLTDLLRIAGERSDPDADPKRRKVIRVSHWEIIPHCEDDATEQPRCVWDSHPNLSHCLDYVVAPPSIVMPEKMRPMPLAARWLRERHNEGSRICSVCAGAFVLAESGLVDGRRITTHWAFAKQLANRFPAIDVAAENMVLDDGDIITAGGILAWTDLGLTLVDRLMGPSAMLATARFLLIEPPRRYQQPFSQFIPPFDHGDEIILSIQHHLHADPTHAHSIGKLATIAGHTERTFLRRFAKATGFRPTEYLQNVRISKAREILETTNRSVEQIAWQVGYSDPAAFRKIFQRLTSLSPTIYRHRFGIVDRIKS
ncbi:MAG: GlxA family transcriptional regulator [Rhizobiaceae bacterium]|nr:GlxA family transcriptional regulator [Rhizobiaceae bacterium]